MIDSLTVARILDTAHIVDVVSDFVTLRRRGVNYVGLCPFHDDTTPSFYVSPAKGFCKCFACGKGGNAVHFIMEHEQMSYPDALKYLAKKYGIEIHERELTDDERKAQDARESMYIVNQFANDYFHDLLLNNPEGRSVGMAYFRSRGFRDDIIEKFHLGFALDQWDAFSKDAISKGYNKDYLIQTGLCSLSEKGSLIDKFRGRAMFPIFSLSGKVVGFSGRVLASGTKGIAQKYVNSPDSEIYHKSNELYGIFQAKHAIGKYDLCYIVEGQTDVISMHQCGIENVVAPLGTALTTQQIKILKRFTNNITLLNDGDAAGIHASQRDTDMLLAEGINVKLCLLPDQEDPDSFARKHTSEEFKAYIQQHGTDFVHFKTSLMEKDAENDPIKRSTLIKEIIRSIAIIPDDISRDVYIRECAQLLHTEDRLLVNGVAQERIHIRDEKNKESERERLRQEYLAKNPAVDPSSRDISHQAEESGQSFSQIVESPVQDIASSPKGNAIQSPFYLYEKQIMEMFVRYGENSFCDIEDQNGRLVSITVAEYIRNELQRDNSNFQTPILLQMMDEALAHIHEVGFSVEKYFLNHPDPRIAQVATDLASERYQLSKYHTEGQSISTVKDRLAELVPQLIANYKKVMLTAKMRQLMNQLKNPVIASDSQKCKEIMQECERLCQLRNAMAQFLGERVVQH